MREYELLELSDARLASEMIYGLGMMIENETRVTELKELVFPHPTVSEIIKETLFAFGEEETNA